MKVHAFLSFFTFLIVFGLLAIHSCSPSKSFEKGNYEKSYDLALNQLENGNKTRDNKEILIASLDKIIEEDFQKIENLRDSLYLEDVEVAYELVKDLQSKIEESSSYTSGLFVEDYNYLLEEKINLEYELIEGYYIAGIDFWKEAKDQNDKYLAQRAHQSFDKSKMYGNDYGGLDTLLEKSLDFGQIIYYVEADARFDITHNWDIDQRFDDLQDTDDLYNKIYYEDVSIDKYEADCYVSITFENLDITQNDNRYSREFSNEIVVGQKEIVDANGQKKTIDVTETIYATVIINETEYVARWQADTEIEKDSKYCDFNENRYTEEVRFQTEEYEVSGDSRAVPARYRQQPTFRSYVKDDLVRELIDQMYQRIYYDLF